MAQQNQNTNPFDPMGIMKLFDPMSIMNELQRNIERYAPGGTQMPDLMQAQRKNLEALVEANQLMFNSTQQLVQRQTELLQQASREMTNTASTMATAQPGDLQQQMKLLAESYGKAIAALQEVAGMVTKAQQEALQVLDRRWRESIEEMRTPPGKGSGQGKG